jgi:GTPase SAR1 family protein
MTTAGVVVTVGASGCGKTCLLLRLTKGSFSATARGTVVPDVLEKSVVDS